MENPSGIDRGTELAFAMVAVILFLLWVVPIVHRTWKRTKFAVRVTYLTLRKLYHKTFHIKLVRNESYSHDHYYDDYATPSWEPMPTYARTSQGDHLHENFRPWRKDYLKAFFLCVIGFVWIGFILLLYRQQQNIYIPIVGMLAVVPMYYASTYHDRALNRKRGKAVEKIAQLIFAESRPQSWRILDPGYIDNVGDIDILVKFANTEKCVIEIKAWNQWSGFIRTKRALAQVRRQRHAVGASYSVIWLPQAATAPCFFASNTFIVAGKAKYLIESLRGIIRHNVIIKFPQQPPAAVLDYVKLKRFRWNKTAIRWEGRRNQKDIDDMRPRIAAEGGSIMIVDGHQNR